jgi:hypothetical protein
MSSEFVCMMDTLNVVYLNVRTLLGGKEYILIQDLIKYKIDIAFLSEVRWYEQGDISKDEYQGYHFLCSRGIQGLYGVAVVLSPRLYTFWKDGGGFWDPISPRLVKIRIPLQDSKCKFFSFIGVYAPTQASTDEDKDLFYDHLGSVCDRVSKGDILVVLGDFNARVGKFSEEYPKVVGKHGLGKTSNGNGNRVIDFCLGRHLCVMNTFFQRPELDKGTWKDSSGYFHMIDHILVQQDSMNLVTSIKNQKEIALDTDHTMVIVSMKVNVLPKTRKHRYVSGGRIDHDKLKIKELCAEYDNTVFLPANYNDNNYYYNTNTNTNNINTNTPSNTTNTNTTNITTTTTNIDYIYNRWKNNIVRNKLFKREKRRTKAWMSDQTLLIIEEKRRMAALRDSSLEDREAYKIICKKVKKAVTKDKHLHMANMITDLNKQMKQSNLHHAFNIIKKKLCAPEREVKSPPIKDYITGCMVDNITQQLKLWVNYFNDLFNPQVSSSFPIGDPRSTGGEEMGREGGVGERGMGAILQKNER